MELLSLIFEYSAIILAVIVFVCSCNKLLQLYQQGHYHTNILIKNFSRFYFLDKNNYIFLLFIPIIFFCDLWYVQMIYTILAIVYWLGYLLRRTIVNLKFTFRIVRLYLILIFISTIIGTLLMYVIHFNELLAVLIIIILLIPVLIMISGFVIYPVEYLISLCYQKQAKKKIDNIEMIIAITGSAGKTSVKNFLFEMVKYSFLTFKTKKSFNTINGIAMNINNNLSLDTEIAILEYGASHVKDINKLCDFIKPKYGIITNILPQHLSSFKTIDNIINEKLSLIDNCEKCFINIDNKYIKERYEEGYIDKCKVITYSISGNADWMAKNIQINKEGMSFDCVNEKVKINVKTKLLGNHNIANILVAVACSYMIGIKKEEIINALKHLENVEHRLQIKQEKENIIIDDSYNANEEGFLNALDVLNLFENRKIVITPGLVEGAEEEEALNRNVGYKMNEIVDFVYLIKCPTSKIIASVLTVNYMIVDTFQEAIVKAKESKDSVILIENDIIDLYK